MLRLSSAEKSALVFIVPANILYTVAAVTHAWFQLPPHSFYGLWWAVFCDVLRCQITPAFFNQEPMWYHVLQLLSLLGWTCISLSLLMLVTNKFNRFIPHNSLTINRRDRVACACLISVFAISTSLILFYTKLRESSIDAEPEISWSAILASISCICQITAGIILLQTHDFKLR